MDDPAGSRLSDEEAEIDCGGGPIEEEVVVAHDEVLVWAAAEVAGPPGFEDGNICEGEEGILA
jgi:hypothetical protein